MRTAFLEIGALFENTWTGIPNVIAAIAEGALRDTTIEWTFLFESVEVPRSLVEHFIAQHSGAGGLAAIEQLVWSNRPIQEARAKASACVYTSIKPMRRMFGLEASIIYDLSPLLTPQFHNTDNINHFADRIRQDIDTSDHLFCISEACRSDVERYFGKANSQTSIIQMGVDFDKADLSNAHLGLHREFVVEPYIAVLGTLEPRKNGQIVLDYLAQNPDFANRYRVVFIGREGWLGGRQRLAEALAKANIAPDRVVFTGYVTEAEKVALTLNSAFCVYPSFFEGYGLPVLEAGVLGKVTVCSNSSSIPEVFPENCVFFNPLDEYEFANAMRIAEIRSTQSRSSTQSLSDIIERTEPYSWERCYPGVANWVRAQPEIQF